MPATRLSLNVTEEYRAKLTVLPRAVQREARILWKGLNWDDLRGSYAPIRERVATSIEYAQREAVHLTAGYMGAFLTSELGKPTDPPTLAPEPYVGRSFNDTPLREALNTPLITVLVGIRDGMDDPLGLGLRALLVNVDLHVMRAGRQSLIDAIAAEKRCDGFQRAVKGTCPACAAKAGADGKVQFPVHPGCQCVGEPVIDGPNKNRYRRRDAQQRFDDLSFDQQNEQYGFDIAQLIRDVQVDPAELARVDGSFMSTKGLKDLTVEPRSPLSLKQRMDKLTNGLIPEKPKQPIDSFEDLFKQAEQTKQEYRELLDLQKEFQTRLGADATVGDDLAAFEKAAARLTASDRPQIVIAPLKRRATAEAKLLRKGYGPEGLSDINRGSIIVRDQEDLATAFAQLRRVCTEKGWKMAEVEDRFSGEAILGYRDMAVNLIAPSGHVTEFQFHINNMWAAKFRGGGHQLYEEVRKFTEIKATRPLTGLEKAEQRRLGARSVELYNKALVDEPVSAVKAIERPSSATIAARIEEMSVSETETYLLGPTRRSLEKILKGEPTTRLKYATRDKAGNIIWARNQYLFDQRWDMPVWTKARRKFHESVVKKFLNGEIREEGIGVPRSVERPRLVSTAGGGASGKSSMIRAGQVDFGEDGAVTVANDLIKESIREYQKMIDAKDPWAANAVNEESAYIAKLIAEAAVKNHYNVLLDIVGDGPQGVFAQSIRGFEAAGYSIEVDYASCPLSLAQRRALTREAKTGRRADPEALTQAHLSVAERFNEINAIDSATVRVYDTTTEGPTPLLVYEKLAGQKGRIIDKAGWKRWLDKRYESDPEPAAVLQSRKTTLKQRQPLEGDDALKFVEGKAPTSRYKKTVEDYQFGNGKPLNRVLRDAESSRPLLPLDGTPPPISRRLRLVGLRNKLDAMLEDTGALGRPVVAWRGLPGRPQTYGLIEGRTVTEKGFSSTSLDKGTAQYFADPAGGVADLFDGDGFVMKTTIHPDVRAAYIGKTGMKELVVERDARYVVTHADRHNVTVNVLPPKARLTLEHRTGGSRDVDATSTMRARIEEAVKTIRDVHRVPDRVVPIKIRTDPSLNADVGGQYRVGRPPHPSQIAVNPTTPNPELAVAHEYGHHFDLTMANKNIPGQPYGFGSESDPALQGWRDAINETKLIKELRAGKLTARMADGSIDELDIGGGFHPDLEKLADYLLEPREMWARSYAQWIGLRSGKFKPYTRHGDVIDAWDADDFKPIAKALDDYFAKLGLRERSAPSKYEEIDDLGHGRWKSGAPKMSPQEQVAFRDYVSPDQYANMQTYWRDREQFDQLTAEQLAGHEVSATRSGVLEHFREQVGGRARALSDAIEIYGKSWRGDIAYRRTIVAPEILEAVDAGEVKEFVEPGFLSIGRNLEDVTAIARQTHARNFSQTVVLKVRIASDRPGLSPTDAGLHTFDELVYGPGTRLRFVGRIEEGVYEVELV